jgi:hypothetical protein
MWNARKGSCLTGRPSQMYLSLASSRPRKKPQLSKVKLPNASHLSIPIYSRVNNEEYLAHVVAVLCIIKQKGLPRKCRVLAKAVVNGPRRSRIFKKPRSLETPSRCLWTLQPARWRLSGRHRCSKKPRRLVTRQSPRCTSN